MFYFVINATDEDLMHDIEAQHSIQFKVVKTNKLALRSTISLLINNMVCFFLIIIIIFMIRCPHSLW